jgi:hypothetical protein
MADWAAIRDGYVSEIPPMNLRVLCLVPVGTTTSQSEEFQVTSRKYELIPGEIGDTHIQMISQVFAMKNASVLSPTSHGPQFR